MKIYQRTEHSRNTLVTLSLHWRMALTTAGNAKAAEDNKPQCSMLSKMRCQKRPTQQLAETVIPSFVLPYRNV